MAGVHTAVARGALPVPGMSQQRCSMCKVRCTANVGGGLQLGGRVGHRLKSTAINAQMTVS